MIATSDPDDPAVGLAGERTDLAWGRTGLSLVAILGTLVRVVLATEPGFVQIVAVAVAAVGAASWAVGLRHARLLAQSTATVAGRATSEHHTLRTITIGTVTLAAAGALLPLFTQR